MNADTLAQRVLRRLDNRGGATEPALLLDGEAYTADRLTGMLNDGSLPTLDGLPVDTDLINWRSIGLSWEYPRISAAMQFLGQMKRRDQQVVITVHRDVNPASARGIGLQEAPGYECILIWIEYED